MPLFTCVHRILPGRKEAVRLDDAWHSSSYSDAMIIIPILATAPMFAAAGYSLVYLLAGGGLGGAVLIFIVAKLLGK